MINSCQYSKQGRLPLLYFDLKQPTSNFYHRSCSTKAGVTNKLDNDLSLFKEVAGLAVSR